MLCWIKKCILFETLALIDDTHMTFIKIVQFSRPPKPLVRLRPKFFQPFDHGRPISDNESPSPSLQMTTNQLKKHTPRMTIICYQDLPSRQLSSASTINLSFDFFSLKPHYYISFFEVLYSCVCSCPKIPRNNFYL